MTGNNAKRIVPLVGLLLLVATAAPVAAETVKSTILLTSDIYKMAESEGRGGYARLGAVVKAERAASSNVLVIHAGDAFSPCLLCGFDQGRHVVDITNRIAPDIFVPGNHEFDFGRDVYLKRMSEARFPVLAANLRGPDGKLLPGHADTKIITVGTAKIGFVGATAEDSYKKSNPEDLKITAVVATVKEQAKLLRAAGADLVVAVVHAAREIDFELYDSRVVDIVLSGDDHDLRMMYDGKSVMAEAGQDALNVVALDLTIDVTDKGGVRSVTWRPHFRLLDSANVTPDADISSVVKAYEAELSRELDVPVATLLAPLDSRNATVRTVEASIGNLITDAVRQASGADIAVMNGGGIRGGKVYPVGHALTRRDVISELPFGNLTLVFELMGAEIRQMAEIGVAKSPTAAGSFLHYSGMTVEADLSKPSGTRVTVVTVGGQALSDTKLYTVASSDFFQRGGDGFTMFKTARLVTRVEDAKLIANDVMVYARKLDKIDVKPEGRVVLK